jgi:hypothetical protein
MQKATPLDDRNARHRQRVRAAGGREVLFQLPDETVTLIDSIKERHGLRSRSQALLRLIERGKEASQEIA